MSGASWNRDYSLDLQEKNRGMNGQVRPTLALLKGFELFFTCLNEYKPHGVTQDSEALLESSPACRTSCEVHSEGLVQAAPQR